MLTEDEHEG